MSTSKTLLTLARVPVQSALARLVQLPWPVPVQRFMSGGMQRLLSAFPVLSELLARSRTVIDRAAGQGLGRAPIPVERSAPAAASTPVEPIVAPAPPLSASALEQLLQDLRGPIVEPAVAAVEKLAHASEAEAHAALVGVIDNADGFFHPLVRVAVLHALAADRSPAVRQAVITAIDSLSAEVSLAAIAVIAQYPNPHAVAQLQRVVEDRSGYFAPEVVGAAEQALKRFAVS